MMKEAEQQRTEKPPDKRLKELNSLIVGLFLALITVFIGMKFSFGFFLIVVSILFLYFWSKMTVFLHLLWSIFRGVKEGLKEFLKNPKAGLNFDIIKEIETCWKDIREDVKLSIAKGIATFIVIVILCFGYKEHVIAVYEGFKIAGNSEKLNEETDSENDEEVIESQDMVSKKNKIDFGESISDDEHVRQQLQGYRFVLEEPKKTPEFDPDIISQVYFCAGDINKKSVLDGQISDYFDSLIMSKRQQVSLQDLIDEQGNTYRTYDDMELEFRRAVEKVSFATNKEFGECAPVSAVLDACMAGRENLNSIEVNGKSGNPQLWWRLANDYQYYAQEYEAQTLNGTAITYYYTMSIYCCMQVLQYNLAAVEGMDYETIYKYMYMRYQDISRNESLVLEIYKKRAAEIWYSLQEYNVQEALAKANIVID